MAIIVKPAGETKFHKLDINKLRKDLGIGQDTENSTDTEIEQSPETIDGKKKTKRRMVPKPASKSQKK